MSGKSKILLTVLLTFSVTCIMFVLIFNTLGISVGGGRFNRLEAVSRIIESKYIGEFDEEKAEDAAISAMLSSIDDPYSVYYSPEETESLMTRINGGYVGVGIEVTANIETDEIVVISVYGGSPAQRAGVMSGDVIVAIDGVNYSGATLNDAVAYMKGEGMESPKGKEFVMTVRRGDDLLDLTMTREEIDTNYIEKRDLGDGLLYLRYTGFSKESAQKLSNIINKLDGSTRGIVLDLRENPGGDLDAAVDVCDLFLDDGLIMYTEDKDGNRDEMRAKKGACDLPLTILVDGGTASASEIVAGCMQARGRATIIGEKTYGKGVSQMIFSVGSSYSDGVVKVTSYKNYRPDGIWLNEGVTPDIEAASSAYLDEYGNVAFDVQEDEPLRLAIEELK